MSNVVIGAAAVSVGLIAASLGVIVTAFGVAGRYRRWNRDARRLVALMALAAVVAFAVMERALITRDFTVKFVAENGSSATPALFNFATLWSALEGSILLWALVLCGYVVAVAVKFRHSRNDPMLGWALLVLFAVCVFFFALMVGPASPFVGVNPPPNYDGPGPNPLLQNHILMAFHPPVLYLGYVGFTVPFAFAIAALATGRLGEGWLTATRRWTVAAWGFLTLGIVLGAWWSYETLGWGGYWAWDPVENASFLPWLTGTAYLHSVMVQERRAMLRVWNLSLLIATFSLTILGTFLTRSGVLASVHAFTESGIGPAILGFFAVIVLVSLAMIGWRGDLLRSPDRRINTPVSREGAFLANNALFAVFAFVVLLGTVFPLIVEAVDGRTVSVGNPYFDRMTRPVGLALLFLMAVAPMLSWGTPRPATGKMSATGRVSGDKNARPAESATNQAFASVGKSEDGETCRAESVAGQTSATVEMFEDEETGHAESATNQPFASVGKSGDGAVQSTEFSTRQPSASENDHELKSNRRSNKPAGVRQGPRLWQRLLIPAWIAAVVLVLSVMAGARGWAPLLAFGLAGFAGGSAMRQLALAVRRNRWRGLVGRTNGGMIVHLGVVLVAVAFAASQSYVRQAEFDLAVGQTASFAGHQIRFVGSEVVPHPNRTERVAYVDVDGAKTYGPAIAAYPFASQTIGIPSVRSTWRDDIALSVLSFPEVPTSEVQEVPSSLPETPTSEIPEAPTSIPEVPIPEVPEAPTSIPEVPTSEIPEVSTSIPEVPEVSTDNGITVNGDDVAEQNFNSDDISTAGSDDISTAGIVTDRVILRVTVQPLVVWLWLGGIVMALGTALSLIPARPKRHPQT